MISHTAFYKQGMCPSKKASLFSPRTSHLDLSQSSQAPQALCHHHPHLKFLLSIISSQLPGKHVPTVTSQLISLPKLPPQIKRTTVAAACLQLYPSLDFDTPILAPNPHGDFPNPAWHPNPILPLGFGQTFLKSNFAKKAKEKQ